MMYKAIGVGLFGLFFMLLIPTGVESQPDNVLLYGAGSIVQKNAIGEVVLENTVHNKLVDQGENFLLFQTFRNATAVFAAANSISTICAYVGTDADNISETRTADAFDAGNGVTGTECQVDSVATMADDGTAVLVVDLTTTNADAADEIGTIGVCQDNGAQADNTNFSNCATNTSILFSAIDITNVTLGTGGTVTITYTFDISGAD